MTVPSSMSLISKGKPSQTTSADSPFSIVGGESRLTARVKAYLNDRDGALPVWIRAPKTGTEFYTGASRAKLYEWASKKYIRSVSIREPGQIKGTRVFNLLSILAFIEKCEAEAVARQ